VAFYRSFRYSDNGTIPDVPLLFIDNKPGLRRRYEKPCPKDCVDDRFDVKKRKHTYKSNTLQEIVLFDKIWLKTTARDQFKETKHHI
jgi:hypothetical protein